MKKTNFIRSEQETHIWWDAEERIAHIYTAEPAKIKQLDKLVEAYPDTYACIWSDEHYLAKKYIANAKLIRFGKPASEKQISAAARNGLKSRFHP